MKQTKTLLTPANCALLLIDYQPQMIFGVQSIDRQTLVNNVTALAKAAKLFKIPTTLTTVAAKTFSGYIFPEIQAVFPEQKPIDRTSLNSLDDARVEDALKKHGRKKIIMAGLWTEICLAFPVLSALEDGYEVYIVVDASGASTTEAHQAAIQRMMQVGATPVTWLQVLIEFQRDWAHKATYDAVLKICQDHGGAYGMGINYAHDMLPGASE